MKQHPLTQEGKKQFMNKNRRAIILAAILLIAVSTLLISREFLKHFRTAYGLYEKKDIEGAIKEWKICERLNPFSPKTANNLGLCYYIKGWDIYARSSDFEKTGQYRKLKEIPEAKKLLGKAIAYFGKASTLNPFYINASLNLSDVYYSLSVIEGSKKYKAMSIFIVWKVARLQPGNELANHRIRNYDPFDQNTAKEAGFGVMYSATGTGIQDGSLTGNDVSFPASAGRVYYFTVVTLFFGPFSEIYHNWYHDGRLVANTLLSINGAQQSVWSGNDINASSAGKWMVTTTSKDGIVVDSRTFEVSEAVKGPGPVKITGEDLK